MLTGLPGSTPSVLGLICLAYVALPVEPEPEPTPIPTPAILGGDWIPPWKKKDLDKERLKKEEEEDIMAVMLTLLSTE